MVTVPVASAVYVFTLELLMVRVQVRTLAETTVGVAHVLLCDVGAGVTPVEMELKLTDVPVGMAVKVIVKVWFWPTSLMASGAISIDASTYVLVAGPELPCVVSVD